ncbi:plasmid stability protein StbB [Haloarcula marismortui ATCC 43049]|uniref:Ribonuclease VapC n=1 Tax=Haloarcula marismortui (strain ATCC 43049 / DSM 3752 / JCM 8966 / VKM B-1809) TaxID=272569 RepID=Q5V381_HALMA|nr:type II toxin-antitoxin system VapC family toxin [Haloarcula marismortui]AAV46021.1 plasmid stability protein StbB [Haloarcula marismortui ATCC 43049]QCP90784.1 type II toxin-antitoxin system VapC family toxin [Haloarcula marismortui ATCC 43049]
MILLDNNIIRKYAHPDPDEAVLNYLSEHRTEPWGISAIVLFEFLSFYDTQAKQRKRRSQLTQAVDTVISFDGDTAAEAASMETSLEAAGVSLDDVDLLIAATARQHQATFVTADKNDFDKTPVHELVDIDIVDAS